MLPLILFYVFATILVAAAVGVIVSRNPVYSALLLVLCFATSAAIWILLQAEFLALVLVLVYVGAVMVLFLFVVMMLDIDLEALRAGFTRFAWLGWLTAAVVVFEIVGAVFSKKLGIEVMQSASPLPARLQQHHRARRAALYALRLPIRDCRDAAAGGDHRGDRVDAAAPSGPEGAEHRQPGRGARE